MPQIHRTIGGVSCPRSICLSRNRCGPRCTWVTDASKFRPCRCPKSGPGSCWCAWNVVASAIPISRRSSTICFRRRGSTDMRRRAWSWGSGEGVTKFPARRSRGGFHHIPCRDCFYCAQALCPMPGLQAGGHYGGLRTGRGRLRAIHPRDGLDRARWRGADSGRCQLRGGRFVEPVNTCHKAAVAMDPQPGDVVLIQGQGPIGLIFTLLVARTGATIVVTDTIPERLALARRFGAREAVDPRTTDVPALIKKMTAGRGADQVFVAASVPGIVGQAMAASRPGSRILLFAQTSDTERIELSGAGICKLERTFWAFTVLRSTCRRRRRGSCLAANFPWIVLFHTDFRSTDRPGIELALHPDRQILENSSSTAEVERSEPEYDGRSSLRYAKMSVWNASAFRKSAPRRRAGTRQGRPDLRDRREGLPPRISREDDCPAGAVRTRAGRGYRRGRREGRRFPTRPARCSGQFGALWNAFSAAGTREPVRRPAVQQRRLRRVHPHPGRIVATTCTPFRTICNYQGRRADRAAGVRGEGPGRYGACGPATTSWSSSARARSA